MESRAAHRTLGVGETLNWYRIERVLGRGGFGVIYLATDTNLDCPVAIKEYLPPGVARRADDTTVEPLTARHGDLYRWGLDRFIREARNLVRFKHPNIVRVMSVFQQNNTAYMVMEFEAGETLVRHLERVGQITERRLRALADALVDGLEEVHRHGFIHRDVKPANVLVRPDGSPVLLDFGSARSAALSGAEGMTALVSAGYAPLEQYDDGDDEQQGPWTDIYALGGTLYYAISGSDPVDSARRGAALLNGARDPLIPAATLGAGRYSRALLAAVDWALEHRIADRPQTLGDWRPALLGDAVAVDAEARRRALPGVSPGPVTARRSRRFRDPDDFGPRTGGPGAADATPGTEGESAEPADEGGADGGAAAGTDAGTGPRHAPPHGTHAHRGPPERSRTGRVRRREHAGRSLRDVSRPVVATSVLLGGIGVLWFASEQSSHRAEAARERAALEALALAASPPPTSGGAPPRLSVGPYRDVGVPGVPDAIGRAAGPTSRSTGAALALDADAAEGAGDAPTDASAETSGDGPVGATTDAPAGAAAVGEGDDRARAEAERLEAEARRRETEAEALATREARLAEDALARRRVALAARREAALARTETALADGRLDEARAALDEAREAGPGDERIAALAARLQSAREVRARPVSDDEFEAVVRRFDALKRAIEAKDVELVASLTEPGTQNGLFERLMDGFEALNMEITGIRVRNADKSVTANLRIRDMVRANGDRAVPSPAYRDRDITSRLVDGAWTKIVW